MNTISKVCIHCDIKTDFDGLVKDKRKPDGVISVCKKCNSVRLKETGRYKIYKENCKKKYENDVEYQELKKNKAADYRQFHNENVMLSQARVRARKYNLEFDLELSDIIIPEVCPLMGILLFRGNNQCKDNSPTLDRIDNSKGYTKDNVRVISYLGNRMKSNATKEQLIQFAENIKQYLEMI